MGTHQRRASEKEHRRQSILEAAEVLMQESGLSGLTIDDVATQTQLAKGTIYLYFKSKEDILAALTLKARRVLYNEFAHAVESSHDPLVGIERLILANYTFYKQHPLHYELTAFYNANTLNETDELKQVYWDITKLVTELINKAKADGQVRSDLDPIMFAMCLWGTTSGVIQLFKVRAAELTADYQLEDMQILQLFTDILIKGIRA